MRNFFFFFVAGLVLVSVVTFLYNKHFFNFIELSPTDDDVVLLANPSKNPYNYLMLAQQWPPSHCNGNKNCKISPPTDYFTIHGLWPDTPKCTGPPYAVITVLALLKKLNKEWPDLEKGNNQGFWKYEWDKHGICSNMDQTTYFELTLELKSQYDVLTHLVNNKIKPGSTTTYPVQDIRKSVKQLTKKNPDLNCNEDRNGRPQLHEVRICFDPHKKVIDCPKDGSCKSYSNVYFPLN